MVRVGLNCTKRYIAYDATLRLCSFAVVVAFRQAGFVWTMPVAVQASGGRWTPIIDATKLLETAMRVAVCWMLYERVRSARKWSSRNTTP